VVPAGSGFIGTLASFNGANGSNPNGGLVRDAQGNLYGTTFSGGAFGQGAVFELATGTGVLTTLVSFNGGNGAAPAGQLVLDAQGNLYGITSSGGAFESGTVFELAAGSHTVTTLASFNFTNGSTSAGGLSRDAQGNLYGTTLFGGAFLGGTVFELSPVPEPTSLVLLGLGLVGVAGLARWTRARLVGGRSDWR
jgi:uncharacterized repeat protein (TIGR03803 family)